jgi:para-aminobenzoate synthetase component I
MTDGFTPLVEPLGETAEPAEVCARFVDLPYLIFLDSAAMHPYPRRPQDQRPAGEGQQLDQYSFLSADPVALVRSKGSLTEISQPASGNWTTVPGDALTVARGFLPPEPLPPVSGLPPFQGGLAGYIGYDWGAVLERLPPSRYDDLSIPDVVLGLYDWVIAWDHRIGTAWLISTGLPDTGALRQSRARERMDLVRERLAGRRTGGSAGGPQRPSAGSGQAVAGPR